MQSLGVAGVLLFVLGCALLAGCGDDDTEARIYDVTVTINEDSIDPTTIALRTPDRAVVTVENRSGAPCEFHLGPYVRGLHVEDGDDASIAFTVIDIEEAVTTMGCEGGTTPDGEVQVLDATERE
jgi:hypothetical protein